MTVMLMGGTVTEFRALSDGELQEKLKLPGLEGSLYRTVCGVIREHEATTTVPAEFFDDLLDALDAAPRANAALADAARQARETLVRD